MSDPAPIPPVVVPAPAQTPSVAVSPTGAPTLSQTLIRIAGPLVGLAAVIGFAPEALAAAGVPMPPAPAFVGAVIAWCKVLAVLGGGYLGINSQGKRVLPGTP